MILDAHMETNLATYIYEADINKYINITDTVHAILQALPMAILQYLNNSQNTSILCCQQKYEDGSDIYYKTVI